MPRIGECVFCRIIDGELEASRVYADRQVVAFMDLEPVNPGHILVVLRRHASSLSDLEPGEGAQVFRIAQLAAAAVRQARLVCEGVNLLLADGATAGQEVFHVHLHVIPRFQGDGLGLRLQPGSRKTDRSELDAAAFALREAWPAG
jgi:histidine triad (HIT) family protein